GVINHKTAIFRQINQDKKADHHDALKFPNGQIVLLTFLKKGQQATVLQLPAGAAGSKVAPEPDHVKPLSRANKKASIRHRSRPWRCLTSPASRILPSANIAHRAVDRRLRRPR